MAHIGFIFYHLFLGFPGYFLIPHKRARLHHATSLVGKLKLFKVFLYWSKKTRITTLLKARLHTTTNSKSLQTTNDFPHQDHYSSLTTNLLSLLR